MGFGSYTGATIQMAHFSRTAALFSVAAALLLNALPSQADVYQYIDANGTISLTLSLIHI